MQTVTTTRELSAAVQAGAQHVRLGRAASLHLRGTVRHVGVGTELAAALLTRIGGKVVFE